MITPSGKEIRKEIVSGRFHRVYFYPGGEMPEELSGLFTSEQEADKAIDVYIGKAKQKVDTKKEKNG